METRKQYTKEINLLRAPCTYPRGKTAGYYGAENQKRRATLTSRTQTIMLPVARLRGIASLMIKTSIIGSYFS